MSRNLLPPSPLSNLSEKDRKARDKWINARMHSRLKPGTREYQQEWTRLETEWDAQRCPCDEPGILGLLSKQHR